MSVTPNIAPDIAEASNETKHRLVRDVRAELQLQSRVCKVVGCTCTKPVLAMIVLCGECSPPELLAKMKDVQKEIREEKTRYIEFEEVEGPAHERPL